MVKFEFSILKRTGKTFCDHLGQIGGSPPTFRSRSSRVAFSKNQFRKVPLSLQWEQLSKIRGRYVVCHRLSYRLICRLCLYHAQPWDQIGFFESEFSQIAVQIRAIIVNFHNILKIQRICSSEQKIWVKWPTWRSS